MSKIILKLTGDIAKHAVQSIAYPKLYCLFNAEYVAKDDQCARWGKK